MISRQLEQLARQRTDELCSMARHVRPAAASERKHPIRTQTGWALVAIGLRLAASGGR